MQRSKKLQPVQRFTALKEKDAVRLLGQQIRLLEETQDRIQELMQYREEYAQRFLENSRQGVNASSVKDHHQFMKNLDKAIVQQQQAIKQLNTQVEMAKRQWLAANGKTKAINKLVDRNQQAESEQLDKQEQREIDDRAASKIVSQNKS